MEIQAAERRRLENRPRQKKPVGDHHSDIGREGGELLLDFGAPQRLWREHWDRRFFGEGMNRGFSFCHAAPGWPRRLGVHARDIVPCAHDLAQGWDGEIRRAHEDNA